MKVLLDTNIVLDVLLDREPYSEAAVKLFTKIEEGKVAGYLCAVTITTIYYLMTKGLGREQAKKEILKIMGMFEIAPVNRFILESAVQSGFTDFEDAVVYEAARHVEADVIVTRNSGDFKRSKIPVHTADELAELLTLQDIKRNK